MQGSADQFLEEQLRTPLLEAASAESDYHATIRMQDGYDHSYFFIASFIEEHMPSTPRASAAHEAGPPLI